MISSFNSKPNQQVQYTTVACTTWCVNLAFTQEEKDITIQRPISISNI